MKMKYKLAFILLIAVILILLLIIFSMPSAEYWNCDNAKMKTVCESWLSSCIR
jgi:ABC-type cobalt transport system substrate-binding protein